ncbi:MAG: hypothetical protein CSA95_02180 [Bacteroidetes bacterium]|nr:MAG: hypothetical protein CSA95_02180 [Bacteroidota bacterium]
MKGRKVHGEKKYVYLCLEKSAEVKHTIIGIIIGITLISLSGCGAARRASRGAPLVVKNSVTTDHKSIPNGDLTSLITVTPNKKLLGLFRARLWFYEHFNGKEKNRGEPPALLDSVAMYNTTRQMKAYLHNSGFFLAQVTPQVKVKRGKAKINFQVKAGKPYRYRTINWDIRDSRINRYLQESHIKSQVKEGAIYNAYILDDERDRITKLLKNNGYYLFGKNFIRYEADSTTHPGTIDLTVIITPFQPSTSDDSTLTPHKQYYINNIYVTPDYRPYSQEVIHYDTVATHKKGRKNERPFFFIETQKRRMVPNTILNTLLIKPGERYCMDEVKQTQKRLSTLRIYRFANVEFSTPNSPYDTLLDCRVNLVRRPVHALGPQFEITNAAGNPGIGGKLMYENKNLFRHGEVFRLTLKGALEAQLNSYDGITKESPLLNTAELGGVFNLMFPIFLFPGKKQFLSERFLPRTIFTASYNFQRRPDYSRHITNISFGYEWKTSQQTRHIFNPLEVNSIKIYPEESFTERLNQLHNALYKSQYTDHMIMGIYYSFIRSTQSIATNRNFSFLKLTFETSGNALWAYNKITKSPLSENGYHELFKIRYAQYIKGEVDYRYYINLPYDNQLVFRGRAGIGIPYRNSVAIPFEKGFYGGGSNDMRGWKIRTLGPGTYSDNTLNIERIGDILLEANMEYRFPIYKWFQGALFVDAGNIWLLNENEDFPGGKFKFKNFLKEFSLSLGTGLRLDLNFFILRLDGGIPVRDPAMQASSPWRFNHLSLGNITWNVAIGYPF